MKPRFEVYKDKAGEYRWRFRAKNGRIMADSAEGYNVKTDCLGAINMLQAQFPNAEIEHLT